MVLLELYISNFSRFFIYLFFFLIKFEGFGMKGKGKMVKRIPINSLLIEILRIFIL